MEEGEGGGGVKLGGRGGGVLIIMHGRSCMFIDPRVPEAEHVGLSLTRQTLLALSEERNVRCIRRVARRVAETSTRGAHFLVCMDDSVERLEVTTPEMEWGGGAGPITGAAT